MRRGLLAYTLAIAFLFITSAPVEAQALRVSPSPSPIEEATESAEATTTPEPTPTETPKPDLTQTTEETVGPLEKLLSEQQLGPLFLNPMKYAIRASVSAGVPPNTLVLLLLLPLIAAGIAAARHFIGIRGFGIFLPAALAVVFMAIGPVVGIVIFLVIVATSTLARIVLRKLRIKLQYLPRMSLILLITVMSVLSLLFLAPVYRWGNIGNISIFPLLILVLLAEDFSKVQIGKSARTAISLATETIILSLISFIFLTMRPLQEFALLNPELLVLGVAVFDILMGKYIGLRFLEYWRYRKLINAKQ